MRLLLLISCLILLGCPKNTETKSIEEKEREQRLKDLLEEDFDEIPEASDREEDPNASD